VKKTLLAAAVFSVAAAAPGQLSTYKDWAKSPEAYFLTAAEKQEWARLASDAEAEKFIADYWARRGGERFKEGVTRRMAAADQQFTLRNQKGSLSARGRIFIVLGNPTRVREAREGGEASGAPGAGGATGAGSFETGAGPTAVVQTWIYAKDKFDPSWDIGELQARVNVDPGRGTDELVNAGQVNRVIEKVVEHSVMPAGGAPAPAAGAGAAAAPAPAPGSAPPAPVGAAPAPAAAAAPPPAPAAAALPAATRGLLEPLLKEPPAGTTPGFWGGDFQTVTGDPFYAIQLVLPADKVPAAGGVKIGGVVTREDGSEATSFFEDAALVDMKRGTVMDRAADRSVVLPAGTYRGAFGLFPADGGSALVTGASSFTIPEKSSDFRVSSMILATTLTPLTKRPNPTDAFVFGMEKPIRVEPKGNAVFSRDDGLWYFYTLSNPTVPAEAPAAAPAPAATPAPGAAPATEPTAAAPAPKPRVMTRIGVLRDGKPAFQPATLPADLQPLGPNYYASGSEIPLATFEPGYYTFTLNVRDLNAPKDSAAYKGFDRSGDFVVLTVDGSMPPRPTPAPAKPAPKPTAAPKPKPKS
jgi:GWxTD domain-containing protein